MYSNICILLVEWLAGRAGRLLQSYNVCSTTAADLDLDQNVSNEYIPHCTRLMSPYPNPQRHTHLYNTTVVVHVLLIRDPPQINSTCTSTVVLYRCV